MGLRLGSLIVAGAVLGPIGAQAADAPSPPAIPVTTATAQVGDVPVFLSGLGTVQAFNVVEIKAQVSGTLIALPAREGQEVRKGNIVAEIDPRPYKAALDQAIAQRQEDVATLQAAQTDLQRYANLAKREFAPEQQVQDQQATVNKEVAMIAADTAAIETAQINLDFCIIRAPFDGRVSLYQLDVGNLVEVATQTGIISITQDKPIAVVFTLPEQQLSAVQDARERGAVRVEVSPGSDDHQVTAGTLMTPNNTIDVTTGTISLRAQFDNRDDHLWPGEFVNTRVQTAVLKQAITVPTLAIQHGQDGLFLYTVNSDRTVAQAAIQAGYEDRGRTVITHGLKGQETVVVTGQSRLSQGAHIVATNTQTESDSATVKRTSGGSE